MSNRLGIICFSYPPYPGIGGRRWAKFSKYLTKKNYSVSAYNAFNHTDQISQWTNDISNNNLIRVNSHEFLFQKILLNPSSILQKILGKTIIKLCAFTKYNPYLITSFQNKKLWRKIVTDIQTNKISHLIVSGDPYLFYYASLLKKELSIKLILDYRDLWNDHSFYGSNIPFTSRQKKYFEYAENYAVNNCDSIIFVDRGLADIVKKRIHSKTTKTHIVHNGFDIDDFKYTSPAIKQNDIIQIFFAGNISSDVNPIFINFFTLFAQLEKQKPEISNRFIFEIIGSIDAELEKKLNQLGINKLTIRNKLLKTDEYQKYIASKNIGMIHLSKEYPHSFATKFGDFLKYDVFALSIGYRGDFAEYVEKRKIGMHFSLNEDITFFDRLTSAYNNRSMPDNVTLNEFDIRSLTDKIIEII